MVSHISFANKLSVKSRSKYLCQISLHPQVNTKLSNKITLDSTNLIISVISNGFGPARRKKGDGTKYRVYIRTEWLLGMPFWIM